VNKIHPQKMANANRSRSMLSVNLDAMANDPLRDLFEACKTGDIDKVKKLITPQTANARDTAGRKSTPLHFSAGK
jgi:tankyrase